MNLGGGYHLAFSGGKDSIVMYNLCVMAGVKFTAHYSVTTIDPVEVLRFVKKYYPDVIWDYPYYKGKRTNAYELVALKGLPTRLRRFCCDVLKEQNGRKGDYILIGVRAEESPKRATYEKIDTFKGRTMLRPILDWTSIDIWNFISKYNLPYPSLYDEGHKRLGCILCPLACRNARVRDYNEHPQHVKAIEKNVAKFLETHPNTSLYKWGKTPHEIVYYWVHLSPLESAKGPCLDHYLEKR